MEKENTPLPKKDIPKWGWYNGQLIQALDNAIINRPEMTVKDFFENLKKENKLPTEFVLYNQGFIMSLLYMLLVVPREMLDSKDITINENIVVKLFKEIRVNVMLKNESCTVSIYRHLRNSITHARFEMYSDGLFEFKDEDKNEKLTFQATISKKDLLEFITETGKFFINEKLIDQNIS